MMTVQTKTDVSRLWVLRRRSRVAVSRCRRARNPHALNCLTDYSYVTGTSNLQQVLQPGLTGTVGAPRPATPATYTNDDRGFEIQQGVSGVPVTVKTNTYTNNGQLATVKDANNNLTTYGYDGFDRLLTTTYPNAKVESVAYNPTGTLAQRTTRNNEVITFQYDELNRQTVKDPPGVNNTITTTYDKTGLVDLVKTNGTAVFNHDYDTAGRLIRVTRPDGKIIDYTVDAAGNRAALKYPGTPTYTVNYSYDELGRPKEVKENGTTTLASWSYPDRLNATVTYANTTSRTVQRTLSGELATLTNTLNGEAPQFSLYYNKTGQVTNQRTSVAAYAYQPPGTGSNAYVPNPMNQYGSVGAVTQTFDNNGNLTNDGTWTFGYDAESRLTSASKTGVTASYLYDPFGRREQKTVNSTVTQYLLDGPSVIEEYDGSNTRTARYVYAPNIDEPLYMERNGNRYFYHFDGSGSVVALTGTNGVVVERYAYGPYGETTNTSSVGNPYRYTGRELDAETGLYYYRARYYSTSLGRFLQPDPIGYQGGLNLYAYVGNDPLNLTDPSGLLARDVARRGQQLLNNLTSGLQSFALPPTIPTAAELNAVNERAIANAARNFAIATVSGAAGGAVTGGLIAGPAGIAPGAIVGGSSGAISSITGASGGLVGLGSGAIAGAIEAHITNGGRGAVVGGAVGGAFGGTPGSGIGSAVGGYLDHVPRGFGPAATNFLKAGQAGLIGGAVGDLTAIGLNYLIPEFPQ